jgi:hypothetical protein
MKIDEVFCHTFKALRHELDHDRPRDTRPMWQLRLSDQSDFCRAMVNCGYLSEEQMRRAAQRYRLGRSRDGGVIFWQIDQTGCIFDGKIMHYRPDGHRDHQRHPDWVSSCLKRHYLSDEPTLAAQIGSSHCLFGTHLLMEDGRCKMADVSSQTSSFRPQPSAIAVVEAEKTAVIMSERYPDVLWLAAGGLYELTAVKLFPLRGRRIILFPDTDIEGHAYATWYRVMLQAQQLLGQTIHMSPLLELHATPEQKRAKIDIADYLFNA